MWNFERIQLANYVTWKELDFEFLEGVTFLTGKNYSGKSVTVSSLFPILCNEGSIPQGATARFIGNNGEKSYIFEMVRSTKSAKYNICENNVDLAIHKIATAQEFIRNVFGIPPDLITSTILVNGRRDHALASGKPSTRLDYLFNTLVSSDMYEKYSDIIEKSSKALNEKAIELRTLKDLLSKAKSDKVESSDFDVEKAKEKLSSLSNSLKELSDKERLIMNAIEVGKPPKSSYDSEDKIKQELKKLRKQLSFAEQAEQDKKKLEKTSRFLKEFKELQKALNAPDKPFEILANGCKKQIKIASTNLEALKKAKAKYDSQDEIRSLLEQEPEFSSDKVKIEKELEKLSSSYFHAKTVNSVDPHNQDECPICKSNVDMSLLRSKADKIIESYKTKKKILENDLSIIEAREITLVEKVSSKDIRSLEERIEKIDKFERICSYLADNGVSSSTTYDQSITSDEINEKIEKLEELQNNLVIYQSKLSRERDNPYIGKKSLSDLLEAVQIKKKKLTAAVSELSERIPREEFKKEAFIRWERNYSSLKSKVNELKDFEKDIEVIKGLKKAFSRDGFRLHKLEKATDLFISNLNALVPLVIQEPMKFEAEIDKRKCDIIATRNGKADTIFSLSGAESQIFKMISTLALIRCLPSNLRADTIILDEIEANCDENSSVRYARDFIPELKKSVSKILVISPKSLKALPLQPDHAFQVVKKAGRSSLEHL